MLKVMDMDELKKINQHIVKKGVANKIFENGTIDGYTVVAINGTRFFGSILRRFDRNTKNSITKVKFSSFM
ncbi:hypothetical protein [Desulfitobacterium sp.]|uniref:hypothetical protein n=1 Tax=Desulfitobacterium sp. TaxID=49981 RepID=UPI002BAC8CB2|nr:hypothetical protein [Desulfitobacterium sp.]HVJ50806.1 hypothetical protein [Desulfitobacterium sp.]